MKKKKIIAVDFDGTIAISYNYPGELKEIRVVTDYLRRKMAEGESTIILYTCRNGRDLQIALDFCKQIGLKFDYVNENTKEKIAQYGDTRKIYADVYIDDHAIFPVESQIAYLVQMDLIESLYK